MNDNDNIKELFQKELGNYKAKVDPNLWNGIQSSIGSVSAAGTTSSIGLVGKTIIGASIVAAVTIGSIVLVKNNKTTTDNKENREASTNIGVNLIDNKKSHKNVDLENNENEINPNEKKVESVKKEIINTKDLKYNTTNTLSNNNEKITFTETDNPIHIRPISTDPINKRTSNSKITNKNKEREKVNVDENKTTSKTELENNLKIESSLAQVEIEIIYQNNQFVRFAAKDVPKGATIEWSFGDGNYSYTYQPEHFFNKAGNYNVELTLRKENIEITKSTTVSIKIKGEIGKLPNVFTPNGDGRNDVFFIKSKHLKSFQLTIMDMNQKVIYTTNDPNFRWKGLDKYDQPVKEGNYIYIIVAEDESGNTINKFQKLTIHR